jgi:hypothetical protein
MRQIERRRIAEGEFAFLAVLEAAMEAVVEAAQKLRQPHSSLGNPDDARKAYLVRQRVKRAGFAELRSALVRSEGMLTAKFLQLDKEIEDFAGRWVEPLPHQGLGGVLIPQPRKGVTAGLQEQLERIEQQAIALRDEAALGLEFWRKELGELLLLEQPRYPPRSRRAD